jgi:hypothetical protein
MMVGGFVAAAAAATKGDPRYGARRAALLSFWEANADQWGNGDTMLDLAADYASDDPGCDGHYFGANIAFIPAYVWALGEPNTQRQAAVVDRVIGALHDALGADKNAFFDAITVGAGLALGRPMDTAVAAATLDHVRDFPPPPRVERDIDGGQGGCSDDALDVGDRPVVYFQWHSNPWSTRQDANPRQTYPGHDYLVAYWLSRQHGIVDDERPGVCLQR